MSESILSQTKLEMIDDDRPLKITKFARMGGKDSKMSKSNQPEQVKAPKAKYSKTRGEHFKDIVIAVLVAGVIAFIGGMMYANAQTDRLNAAVSDAKTAAAPAPVKK